MKMRGVIFLLGLWLFAEIKCNPMDKICAEFQSEQSEWKQHCHAYQTGEQKQLELHCRVLLVSKEINNIGLFTTLKLTSKENRESNEPSQCLQLTGIELKKINPELMSNSDKVSRRITISKDTIVFFNKIENIDVDFRIQSDRFIGGAKLDSNCIRDQQWKIKEQSLNNYFNVSTCVRSVKLNNHSSAFPDGISGLSINLITDQFGLQQINPSIKSAKCSFISNSDLNVPKKIMQSFSEYQIENLYLKDAGTESLKNDYFPSMPTLQLLDLSECKIMDIEKNAFKTLPNLKHLNLAGNKFSEVPVAVFQLKELETLNVSSNGEFNVNDLKELKGLKSLKNLDLSGTQFRMDRYPTEINMRLPNLSVLNISKTSFSKTFVPFLKFPELEVLVLSHNQLENGITDSLDQIKWDRLQTLDLSVNLLTDTFDFNFLFNKFPNLRHLNVAENQVRTFPSLKLEAPSNDNSIYLNFSNNKIQTWATSKLDVNFKKVNLTLDLTNNNITEVSSVMLSDFSKAHAIFLRGNNFSCNSSQFPSFKSWLEKNRPQTDYDKFAHGCFKSSANINQLRWISLLTVLVISTFAKLN